VTDAKRWDVFLSYSRPHQQAAETLALRLEDQGGLQVFLDKWLIAPGQPFITELERALRASRACAVLIGPGEIRPWQNEEMQAALSQAVGRSPSSGEMPFRVIPVLLPGATDPSDETLPAFITTRSLVDFRSAQGLDDEEAFNRLVAGIRGVAPGRPSTPPEWLTFLTAPGLQRPTGIAVDGDVVYVADHEAGTISRFEKGACVKRQAGLAKPHHIIVLGDTLVVTDTHHHELVFYSLELEEKQRTSSIGSRALQRPHGLASNFPGEYYVADSDNHRVLQVRGGEVQASVGRQGGGLGIEAGEFSVPCGVAVSLDCVCVADTYNHRVQVLTRDLRALSSFGAMGHGTGQFAYPVAVATWHNWIVVADEHNKRLQLWRRESSNLPFDVTCVSSDLCDGWLGSPFGLTFDEDGHLFVADRKNGKLLRMDFDAMIAALGHR
jgi:hypothetical protein